MRLALLNAACLLLLATGCAATRSNVQIETRVHKPVVESTQSDQDGPNYDLTARVSFDLGGVQ